MPGARERQKDARSCCLVWPQRHPVDHQKLVQMNLWPDPASLLICSWDAVQHMHLSYHNPLSPIPQVSGRCSQKPGALPELLSILDNELSLACFMEIQAIRYQIFSSPLIQLTKNQVITHQWVPTSLRTTALNSFEFSSIRGSRARPTHFFQANKQDCCLFSRMTP